jgi:hypothetical protein
VVSTWSEEHGTWARGLGFTGYRIGLESVRSWELAHILHGVLQASRAESTVGRVRITWGVEESRTGREEVRE